MGQRPMLTLCRATCPTPGAQRRRAPQVTTGHPLPFPLPHPPASAPLGPFAGVPLAFTCGCSRLENNARSASGLSYGTPTLKVLHLI